MVTLLEGLQGSHEVVSSRDTVCDDPLSDAGRNSALNDSCDRVHWSDDLGLELRWHVKLDLLEEIFGGTETTDYKHVLQKSASAVS